MLTTTHIIYIPGNHTGFFHVFERHSVYMFKETQFKISKFVYTAVAAAEPHSMGNTLRQKG